MGLNEAWFWVGLTTFGTGIYFLIDGTKRRWAASITTLIGVVAMAYSIYAHSHGGMLGLPIWFYLLCVSWVLIGLDVYDRHFRPIAEPSNHRINNRAGRLLCKILSSPLTTLFSPKLLILWQK
jgi:uncharacterized membrane protein YhdT